MKDIEKIAQDIVQAGNKNLFGVLGSGSSLELVDYIVREGGSFQPTFSESAAAIMAGATGLLSGNAGLVVSIKGPGLANMIPGLALCALENFPVVALVESYSISSPRSQAHKRMSHRLLAQDVTKNVISLSNNESHYNSAKKMAEEEKPGPVLINLAQGENEEFQKNIQSSIAKPNSRLVCLREIENSRRPIIIVGSIARRMELSSLIARIKVPIFTTVAAKGVIDECLNVSAGIYTGAGLELTPEYNLFNHADLVIGIGLRNEEVISAHPFPCQSISVDNVSGESLEGFDFKYMTDLSNIGLLLDALNSHQWGMDLVEETKHGLNKVLCESSFLPYQAFDVLSKALPINRRVVIDTGNFCTIAEHGWSAAHPSEYLCAANSRYMGTAIPLGVAVSLYQPNIPTVIAVGDGGIGQYVSELKISVEKQLPLLLIMLSDGSFGSVKLGALAKGLNQDLLNIANPSWIEVIKGIGIPARLARTDFEFFQAVSDWVPYDGPSYIECIFSANEYMNMMKGIR